MAMMFECNDPVEQVKAEKIEKRDAGLFKIVLVVGLPILVLGALLRPERAYETLISSLVQAAGLAAVAWAVLAVKRSRGRRKS